jgi:hypothetical protein
MQSTNTTMHTDPTSAELLMESVRFFGWLIGSICSLAITLLGIYLRLYVRDALHDHADAIQSIMAANYIRRDVYESDIRWLRTQIEGRT